MAEMPELQREFLRRLDKEERVYATSCPACDGLYLPPRARCPACDSEEYEWVALAGTGELYAFTQQSRALRFGMPSVVGLVKLDEGVTAFGVILDDFKGLSIGDRMEATVVRDDKGPPVLGFRPKAASEKAVS